MALEKLWTPILALATLGATDPAGRPILLHSGEEWPKSANRPYSIEANRRIGVLIQGEVARAVINGVTIRGPREGIIVEKGAIVSDLTIAELDAKVRRGCVRVMGERIVLRNVRCNMIGRPRTSIKDLPFGLHVKAGNDILIENSRFDGFQMTDSAKRYWNGDGVSVERAARHTRFRNVSANNNTDAGFDIKPHAKMDNVSASGNCRNFRFWSSADVGIIAVGDTNKRGGSATCAGIWILGAPPDRNRKIVIKKLLVRFTRPNHIIRVQEGGVDLEIMECSIEAPPGTKFLTMKHREGREIKLGKGCPQRV